MTEKGKFQIILTVLCFIPIALSASSGQPPSRPPSLSDFWLTPKYGLLLVMVVIGTLLIWFKKMKKIYRVPLLTAAVIIFGGVLIGIHPSPVCATTKPFQFGLKTPFLAVLIFVGVVTIISNKSFCGAACPAGALQELIYWLPTKKRKLTFRTSNSIRVLFAVTFFMVVVLTGISIYAYGNYFEIFHWYFPAKVNILFIVITPFLVFSILALRYYRPFCYLVCPMGLVTWLLEQVSLTRIKLKKELCTDCNLCLENAPCPSIESIISDKSIRADCHLCGECIGACPEQALDFGTRQMFVVKNTQSSH